MLLRRDVVICGQQGGENEKPSVPKCLEGSETFWNSAQLFSSFLRGASCPKSPRVAAFAATSFIPENSANVNHWLDLPADTDSVTTKFTFRASN